MVLVSVQRCFPRLSRGNSLLPLATSIWATGWGRAVRGCSTLIHALRRVTNLGLLSSAFGRSGNVYGAAGSAC